MILFSDEFDVYGNTFLLMLILNFEIFKRHLFLKTFSNMHGLWYMQTWDICVILWKIKSKYTIYMCVCVCVCISFLIHKKDNKCNYR